MVLSSAPITVDPRVCGGARVRILRFHCARGRSPRVRGSLCCAVDGLDPDGSIPACAGEPIIARAAAGSRWVDPRVCGGAMIGQNDIMQEVGRSPRVRGSLHRPGAALQDFGSIPACAGEPGSAWQARTAHRVDPRVCGGAGDIDDLFGELRGRSPRVRGSLDIVAPPREPHRSIPACAGEPLPPQSPGCAAEVDPRVCGGAMHLSGTSEKILGRSPRVRGSLSGVLPWGFPYRSIPACAGEPQTFCLCTPLSAVDPRVCGGASTRPPSSPSWMGRSPRVRGSLGSFSEQFN